MAFLVIGLVIGIATVVGLYNVTRAMQSEIANKFDEIGANMTIVPKSDGLSLSYGGVRVSDVSVDVKELKETAIDQIKTVKNKENIANIAPKLMGTFEIDKKEVLVVGVDFPAELRMKKWWKLIGDKPTAPNDILLGSELAGQLHKKAGDTLNLADRDYKVSAVIGSTGGQEDDALIMDLHASQTLLKKPGTLSFIEVSALCSTCPIEEMVKQMSDKLPGAQVTAVKEVIQARKEIVDRFAGLALAVSAVVLLIGALIVFVTMMSSVNERTREIGIFRAIGFRKSHVMLIILLEASVVSVLGGLLGYVVGMIIAKAAGPIIAQMDVVIKWQPEMGLVAVGTAVVIGLLASLLPAVKASGMDPVEALRFM